MSISGSDVVKGDPLFLNYLSDVTAKKKKSVEGKRWRNKSTSVHLFLRFTHLRKTHSSAPLPAPSPRQEASEEEGGRGW